MSLDNNMILQVPHTSEPPMPQPIHREAVPVNRRDVALRTLLYYLPA
jgi:hypothetical protein